MKIIFLISTLFICAAMSACSSNDNDSKTTHDKNTSSSSSSSSTSSSNSSSGEGVAKGSELVLGPFDTGTSSEPTSVYFDLESGQALELTDEEAKGSNEWDIHFRRTDLALNFRAGTPVKAYFTGNNPEFYDSQGDPVKDYFINATSETELEDFSVITAADIPSDDQFDTDTESLAIGGKFYNYDSQTHVVSAASDKYFVVQTLEGNFAKIRVKELATQGRVIASLILGVALQDIADGDALFSAETDLLVETAGCTDRLVVDLERAEVTSDATRGDIYFACTTVSEDTGASFELNLADNASAIDDSKEGYDGIIASSLAHYKFQPNETQTRFFKTHGWYEYALNGGHGIWSKFGVYLIKTASGVYKFQITSYYNDNGESGQFHFRYQSL